MATPEELLAWGRGHLKAVIAERLADDDPDVERQRFSVAREKACEWFYDWRTDLIDALRFEGRQGVADELLTWTCERSKAGVLALLDHTIDIVSAD